MAAIAATPIFMRNVLLTLKTTVGTATEFQCNVSEARVQVTPGDIVTVRTLCSSGVYSSASPPEYALVLVGVQDWDTTAGSEGLAAYLWQNEGQTLTFVLNIHGEAATASASQPKMTGSVVAIPGDYGGVIGEYAELSVELPCTAKPTMALVFEDEDVAILTARDREEAEGSEAA
jgi:hypothetical protein